MTAPGLETYVERFRRIEPLELVTRLTLIFLLVDKVDGRSLQYWILVLSVSGLILPGLATSRYLWFALTAVLGSRLLMSPHTVENHGFLLAYWCLALASSLSLEDPRRALATQARLLIGFCFLFATSWKVWLSDDFMSGDFFHLTFLTDRRFSDFATLLGGISESTLQADRGLVGRLLESRGAMSAVTLETTRQLYLAAIATTWWTAFIEAVLALQFLVPSRRVLAQYRDVSLMIFALSAYVVAPVMGFGWLLMILGIAQTRPDQATIRIAYVFCWFAIAAYSYIPVLGKLSALLA